MQNSMSYWHHMMLQEVEEKELSPKQQKIAKLDPPADKIDAGDFKALRAGAKIEEDNFFGLKVGDEVKFKDTSEDSAASVKYFVNPKATFKITALHHGHPEVPDPNTHATLKDKAGNEIKKKVYTGYLEKVSIQEGEDHEVSMANNSIETIIKHAIELKAKLGNEEKDIPAWIQDHITNAANFISQAAENYHEYGDHEAEDIPVDGALDQPEADEEEMSLQKIMEKIIKNGHK